MVSDVINDIGICLFENGYKADIGEYDSKSDGIFINDYLNTNADQYSDFVEIQLTVKKANLNEKLARKEAKEQAKEIFKLISDNFFTAKTNEIYLGYKNNSATYIINFRTEEAKYGL